eukprot:3327741-Pleurochrysis_carterae.AAC.5
MHLCMAGQGRATLQEAWLILQIPSLQTTKLLATTTVVCAQKLTEKCSVRVLLPVGRGSRAGLVVARRSAAAPHGGTFALRQQAGPRRGMPATRVCCDADEI